MSLMQDQMNRRELLQRVAALMGGAVSAPAVLALLNGCAHRPAPGWKPATLSEAQAELVGEVVDIMIPRTDTPGARDAGVPAFIDGMLKDVYTGADRERYLAGLAELDARAEREHGRGFLALSREQRVALVQAVQDEAAAAERAANVPNWQLQRPFILLTRELTLLGYFCSLPGATEALQYDPVPGGYRACIPLAEAGNGKTWAVETFRRF
jgi:hypothetical protein